MWWFLCIPFRPLARSITTLSVFRQGSISSWYQIDIYLLDHSARCCGSDSFKGGFSCIKFCEVLPVIRALLFKVSKMYPFNHVCSKIYLLITHKKLLMTKKDAISLLKTGTNNSCALTWWFSRTAKKRWGVWDITMASMYGCPSPWKRLSSTSLAPRSNALWLKQARTTWSTPETIASWSPAQEPFHTKSFSDDFHCF